MTRDKKILYTLSTTLVLVLLGALFLPRNSGRIITALLLAAFAIAVCYFVRKRPVLSINKRTVLLLMLAMGAVCLVIYYMTGVHFGFYKSSTPLTMRNFFRYILPISTIIITTEFIRYVFLAQEAKFMGAVTYVAGVLSEVLVFATLDSLTSFTRFMDLMGLYLFPAITANVLYNFLAKHYGCLPAIVYRLPMTLYTYILPAYPQTPDAFFSFAKLLLPLLMYVFISALYAKGKRRYEKPRTKIFDIIFVGISALVMISIVLLISGQFRYRAVIIATESMTGSINVGDAVIYEVYDNQTIREQDIVVFKKNNSLIIHRVISVDDSTGVTRYYTKGDANEDADTGYITAADIEGVYLFRLPQVGQATIMLREAFS